VKRGVIAAAARRNVLPESNCARQQLPLPPVRCIPPVWLVEFHSGYELDDNDWHDVRLLCQRFQIAVPDEYLKFRR
jgi:hypothetical protein